MDQPELSSKLIEKLKNAGLDEIAEVLSSYDAGRMDLSRIDELPDFEQSVDWVCPEGYVSPVSADEQINHFGVSIHTKTLDGTFFFLASSDWSRMAVPISLLPVEVLADPILKRWTWIYDNMAGADECKRLAKSIVRRHANVKPGDEGQQSFHIATPKSDHVFMTTADWRGLQVPEYMEKREPKPRQGFSRYVQYLATSEIEGERRVKKAAREIAREYDKIKFSDKYDPEVMSLDTRQRFWVSPERMLKLKHTMRYIRATEPDGLVNQSRAIGELIDRGFEALPPESEWKRKKPYPWECLFRKDES